MLLPEIHSPSHLKHKAPSGLNRVRVFLLLASCLLSCPLTTGDPPASDPAVVSWAEAGLLARQAGVADEVGRVDVRRRFHQRDVVVQLAVGGISETLVSVDSLHRENPLHRLGALQLMLPQDDPPAPSILCFTSDSQKQPSICVALILVSSEPI